MAGLANLNWSDELPEIPVGVYLDLWKAKPVDPEQWFLQPLDDNQSDDKILTALEQTEKTPAKQLYEGDMVSLTYIIPVLHDSIQHMLCLAVHV